MTHSNNWRGGMSQVLAVLLLLSVTPVLAAAEVAVVRGAEWVSPPSLPDVKTVDMRRLPPAPEWKPGDPIRSIPRMFFGDPNAPTPVPLNPVFGHDALVDRQVNFRAPVPSAFGTPTLNQNVISSTAQPNDPTGDVGTHQFVAAINGAGGSDFAVYDKVTGAIVVPRTTMQSLGSGGLCATGRGDPIVLFDELASRWLLTEFTSSGNGLCVYISDVADLSGSVTWTRYLFTLPNFPDYPKYGVWPNAYFVGANEGSASSTVRPFYAMDRQKMLAGLPATLQRLTIPNLAGFGFQMTQPADLAGSDAPDADAPGLFMRHRDDEAHNPGSNNPNADFIELYEFAVDWTTPANSAITGPITFQISEFSSNLNGLSAFEAFPQPNGIRLDPLRETVMHRLTYRRLANYEVLVGNFVTDLFLGAGSIYPNDTGAVRWFELRRQTGPQDGLFANGFEGSGAQPDGPAGQWTLHQEGTFAPEDTIGTPAEQGDRWMAASSVDQDGNIALAFNMVRQAPAISAGLRYTGRLANDPLGVMTAAENLIIDASGSVSGVRWGDYNDMGIDPVDGCTFWFIGNYSSGGARANRAASFKFDECGGPSFVMTSPAPSVSVCANSASPTNAPPITLNLAAVNGFVGSVAMSYPNPLPTGISGTLTPNPVPSLPGSTVAQFAVSNTATPGAAQIVARGVSGSITRNVNLTLNIATATPGAPSLTAPANAATNVGTTPTFTWSASTQASSYLIEASTSNTFAATLFSQSVTGTSLVSPVALPTGTQIYWRVTANSACGASVSTVFSFTTASAPGDCPVGSSPTIVASEDFEGPAAGWVQEAGGTGTNTWAIGTALPFAGTKALRGITPTTASDQRFVSPAFNLPTVGNGLYLSFQSRQGMEPNGASACYDGGYIEVSVGGGAYTRIATGLLTDPYNGPLPTSNPASGGVTTTAAWCGTQAYLKSVIDLAPYANSSNVRFRFRLGSDTSVAVADGWAIDNVEIKRCN